MARNKDMLYRPRLSTLL